MEKFRWIDDVEAWLKPMRYDEFWREIGPYCLVMYAREDCDRQIAHGLAAPGEVLFGLKVVASSLLSRRLRLERKPATPWLKVVRTDD